MSQPIVTEPVAQDPIQAEPAKYPQHIEAIPGNTDEVWYNIPELGIRMKLNREFAEDLVYTRGQNRDNGGSSWYVVFSTRPLMEIDDGCSPESMIAGSLVKIEGNAKEAAEGDMYLSSRIDQIVQVANYYYMWQGPQATCWHPINDQAIQNIPSAEDYRGSGAKYVLDGLKTLKPITQK